MPGDGKVSWPGAKLQCYALSVEFDAMREKIVGIILALFAVCFIAIIIEEVFLGGRRRRQAQKAFLKRKETDNNDE